MISISNDESFNNYPIEQVEFDLSKMQTVSTNDQVDSHFKNNRTNDMPGAVFVNNIGGEYAVPSKDITMNYIHGQRKKVKWQIYPVAVYLKNPMNKPIIPVATLKVNAQKGIDQKTTIMSSAGADISANLKVINPSLGVNIGKSTDSTDFGYETETNVDYTMTQEMNYYFYQTAVLFCFRSPYGAGYKESYTHGLDQTLIAQNNPGCYREYYGLTSYDNWFFVSIDRDDFMMRVQDNLYAAKTHNEMVEYFMSNQSLLFASIGKPLPTN
ncbi:hypothetical protein RB653_006621 [Dictyostelium firmibasis]|uniref:Monalysin Pore-forming domain-containing protein n=1 Tax=Dictyostelium firmibasis TaxID=79012 RepID=A0AAN7TU78_9MYCE